MYDIIYDIFDAVRNSITDVASMISCMISRIISGIIFLIWICCFSPAGADKQVRLGQASWHIISMAGLEIAATVLSNTMVCPTCECPEEELDRTEKLYRSVSCQEH